MKNDLRIWTPRTRWISKTSWTPDWFVSGKVKLLKIIKTDSVINITRAYTEICPKADTKERHFLPTKDRYSSVRCVILKDKARYLKILRNTSFEFFSLDKDSNMSVITTSYCSKRSLSFFSSFNTVYTAAKSVLQPWILEKYPILQIWKTAGFKIRKTDILSTSLKPNRHLVNKSKAKPTSCHQAKSLTDILSTSQKPNRHLAKKSKAKPTSCQQAKSQTDILSTSKSQADILSPSQKSNRHLVNKPKAKLTSCQQVKSQTDILSTSQKPNGHLVNKPKAKPTSCQQVKSQTDILSASQKPNRHLVNKSKAK